MITKRDCLVSVISIGFGLVLSILVIHGNNGALDDSYKLNDNNMNVRFRNFPHRLLDPKSVLSKNGPKTDTSIFAYDQWRAGYSGWKNLWVYTGKDTSDVIPTNPLDSYSQSGQDKTLASLFPDEKGYFIDMAANDAVNLSNSLLLEQKYNWNGLCIEPNSNHWYGLANRRCEVLGSFISDELNSKIEVVFERDDHKGSPMGGIVRSDIPDNRDQPKNLREVRFSTTFADVLIKFEVPQMIDYLSLDVEGAEFAVMSAFPFDHYQINVITVERPSGQLVQLLRSKDYVYKGEHGLYGDEVWIHQSFTKRFDSIFPHEILLGNDKKGLWVREHRMNWS